MSTLDTRWVLIGTATIVALFAALKVALNFSLGASGLIMHVVTSAAAVLLSYPLGGALIGYFSPGETIKEAGWAAAASLAITWVARALLSGSLPGLAALVFEVVLAWALAILGAKIGERVQGETPEKLEALALEDETASFSQEK